MRKRTTLNKPLLRKLALKLRRLRHEKHYDQAWWARRTDCGTAACIAGHVAVMTGWKLLFLAGGSKADECRKGKHYRQILDVAAEALGLDARLSEDGMVHPLFSADPADRWTKLSPAHASRWSAAQAGLSKERPSRIAADLLDAIADGTVKL